jgi:hypothetical protein
VLSVMIYSLISMMGLSHSREDSDTEIHRV